MNKFLIMSFIFTLVTAIFFSSNVVAKQSVTRGPMECNVTDRGYMHCCQNETGNGGIEMRWCTVCDNTSPPSNCLPSYQVEQGLSNPTGSKGSINPGQMSPPPKSNEGTSPKGGIDTGQLSTSTNGNSSGLSINP